MADVTIVEDLPHSALHGVITAMCTARGLTITQYTVAQGLANFNENTRLWIILDWSGIAHYHWTTNLAQNGINQGILFLSTARFMEVQNIFFAGGSFANRPCTVIDTGHRIAEGINSPFNCTMSGIGWEPTVDGGQVPTLTLTTVVQVNHDPLRTTMPWLCVHVDPTVNIDNDTIVGVAVFDTAIPVADEYNIINNAISFCLGVALPPHLAPETGLDMGIDLPFPFDGFEPLVNGIVALITGRFSLKIDIVSGIRDLFDPILSFFKDPIGFIILRLRELFSTGKVESTKLATGIIQDLKAGSTPEMAEFETEANPMFSEPPDIMSKEVALDVLPTASASPEEAKNYLGKLAKITHGLNLAMFGVHAGIEAGSLGQFEFMKDYPNMVLNSFGYDAIIRANAMIPVEKSVLAKTEQYFNALFTPEIPAYQDLINMVVKEKISIERFIELMGLRGYSKEFAQLIWDAHFIAPSLGQLLIMKRRGLKDDKWLRQLQILVDLDPLYNEVWEQQWYNDPTIRQGRYMFEAGAIDKAKVRDIVVRSGLVPDYVDAFTDYMITFGERQWKRRYILAVASGYRQGSIDKDELTKEVLSVYHSVGIAEWIIKTEDFVKRVQIIKPKEEKVRLLTLGDLKKAYILDKIDEDKLRSELRERNFETDSITILIEILNESKIVQTEGKKVVSLTVAQYLQAWKQGVIDEDDVKVKLFEKGLDMLEVTMIVETKKRQWKLDQ